MQSTVLTFFASCWQVVMRLVAPLPDAYPFFASCWQVVMIQKLVAPLPDAYPFFASWWQAVIKPLLLR